MSNLVIDLFSYLEIIWQLFAYGITYISLILQIILNPFLLLTVVLTLANIYVVIKSKTRSEIVLGYGNFISGFFKVGYSIIIAVIPIMISTISSIVALISGVMSAPPVTVLGTGVAPGTVMALAIMVLIVLYSVFNI